jgi:hypothetical protein
VTAYPQPITSAANLLVSADDPLGDALDYSWTVGGISGILTGSSAVWYNPGIAGAYLVSATVTDHPNPSLTATGVIGVEVGSPSAWPKFHGNLQATGLSPVDTSADSGTQQWLFSGAPSYSNDPAVGPDGTIYYSDSASHLAAVNPNGTTRWVINFFTEQFSCPTIGADGTIYVNNGLSMVALDPSTHTAKWTYHIPGFAGATNATLGADGTVYFGAGNGFYALHSDGTLKWSSTLGGSGVSNGACPLVGPDGTVYIVSVDASSDHLYAVNPDGTTRWSLALAGGGIGFGSMAMAVDGTIYAAIDSGHLYAVNADGSLRAQVATFPTTCSPAIGVDGTVYYSNARGSLTAYTPSLQVKWTYVTPPGNTGATLIEGAPAIGADGTIYFEGLGTNNDLYALYPDGLLKWVFHTGLTSAGTGKTGLQPSVPTAPSMLPSAVVACTQFDKTSRSGRPTGRAGAMRLATY